jgi:hypothetical protein
MPRPMGKTPRLATLGQSRSYGTAIPNVCPSDVATGLTWHLQHARPNPGAQYLGPASPEGSKSRLAGALAESVDQLDEAPEVFQWPPVPRCPPTSRRSPVTDVPRSPPA